MKTIFPKVVLDAKSQIDKPDKLKLERDLIYGFRCQVFSQKKFIDSVAYLDETEHSSFRWIDSHTPYFKRVMDFATIKRVEFAVSHTKLPKKLQKSESITSLIVSVVSSENREVLFLMENEKRKIEFACALKHFFDEGNLIEFDVKKQEQKFILELYKKGNLNGDELLDIKEVKHIFNSIHMECSDTYLREIFAKYDQNNNGSIEPDEFEALVNDLYSKDEIKFLYDRYCSNKDEEAKKSDRLMTIEDLQNFLLAENGENIERDSVQKLVSRTDNQEHLSFIEFSYYIFSDANWIIDRDKMEGVYQDMTRPLNEYYIFSSHNTYALGHQLRGEASPMAYKLAIEKGCRCYELDCWDGPKEPMITHGYTIMKKCTFREVIEAIMQSGFEQTSYPMILTLEMHCKAAGQAAIADIILRLVGEKLYLAPADFQDMEELPSPESLRNKVMIRTASGDVIKLIKQAQENRSGRISVISKKETDGFDVDLAVTEANSDEAQYVTNKNHNIRNLIGPFSKTLRGKPLHLYDVVNMHEEYDERDNNGEGTGTFDYLSKTDRFGLQNSQADNRQTDRNKNGQERNKMEEIAEREEEKVSEEEVKSEEIDQNMENLEQTEKKEEENWQKKEEEEMLELEMMESNIKYSSKRFDPSVLENIQEEKSRSKSPKNKIKKHKMKKPVGDNLNRLLSLFGYNISLNLKMSLIWNVSSIAETNFVKFVQRKQETMIEYTKDFLVRIYPKGTRFDSSNYDPVPGFNFGAQLVALNLQTADMNHAFLTGRFLDNGRCGFILKPKYLRKGASPFSPKVFHENHAQMTRFKIELISGQQLGEMTPNVGNFGVMDPYVRFSMRGADFDETANEKNTFRSKVVYNNGFHPIWKSDDPKENKTEFRLCYPELAVLVVQVVDKSEALIGRNVIPFTMLRPGYRVIPLYPRTNLITHVPNVFILAHLQIEKGH